MKMMKKILSLFLIVFAVCAFPPGGRAANDGDLPVLKSSDRDPRTFCPYDSDYSKDHLLIFVDVTDGISEQQIKMFANDILTEKLLGRVGLYGRVSLLILDGTKPVTGLEPDISICRPKTGNNKSPDKRDHFDIMTENRQRVDIEYRLGYLRRLKEKTIEIIEAKAKNREDDVNTPLMETIHEISRSSAIQFDEDYENKTLVIVSNMYHNSESLPLDRLCVRKIYLKRFSYYRYSSTWRCPSFNDVKNKRANRFYLERKIRPKFKGKVNVKMWMLHKKQQKVGSIRDASLLTFWEDYFDYVQGDINLLETEFEPDPSN